MPRVIQMIDENKEQLRNLFRNYNVMDVQPAISVQLPEDMSALQVPLVAPAPQPLITLGAPARSGLSRLLRWRSLCWPSSSSWLPCSSSS